MTTITRRTACTIEIDEIDVILTVASCFCPDDPDTVQWAPREGGGYNLGWLCQDDMVFDFWEDLRTDSGVFTEFTDEVSRDAFIFDSIEENGAERVFIVNRYEHGMVHYSPLGSRDYPDMEWDVAPSGVFICPDDATEPLAYATAVLNEYSDWCNGSVFGIVVRAVDADSNEIEDAAEECWSFIGYEYATESLTDAVKNGGL